MKKNSDYKPNVDRMHQLDERINSSSNAIKRSHKIDAALKIYYHEMGRHEYNNSFLQYFEDNDFESDDMEDELGEDAIASDCGYIDFDHDFPLQPCIKTENQRQEEIFRILQQCYKYGQPFKIRKDCHLTDHVLKKYKLYGKVYTLNLNLTKNDVMFALQRYKKQCKHSFANKALTDNGMAYSFAVGIKNNNFSFLRTLLDCYMRDSLQRAIYYNKHISNDVIYDINTLNDYSIQDWADRINLRDRLQNIDANLLNYQHYLRGNIYESILSGMDKYLRISPRLHINPLMLIEDDIYQIAKYMLMATDMVQYILNQQSQNNGKQISFQLDLGIVCRQTLQKKGSCFPSSIFLEQVWSDDDSEDPNLDQQDNVNVDVDGGIKWTSELLEDQIGDIENRLISNNNTFVKRKMSACRIPENVQKLQQIDDENMNLLIDVCQKYLTYDPNKSNQIINFSSFEYRKQNYGVRSESYNKLCDEIERLKILSLRHIMDLLCPEMAIDRVIFEILDFEMAHDTIYQLLNRFIENNIYESFGENKQIMQNMYQNYTQNVGYDPEFYYPNGCRFCAVIDRRMEKEYKYGNNKRDRAKAKSECADTMYMFRPLHSDILPLRSDPDVLPEWYFDATQTSFLPKFQSNGNVNNDNDDDDDRKHVSSKYQENQQKSITSRSLTNGKLLILSFIVESKDVIKCYLFRDSTFIRFQPQDIIDILPGLFVKEYKNNAQFASDNVAKQIVNRMQYIDKDFSFWYK